MPSSHAGYCIKSNANAILALGLVCFPSSLHPERRAKPGVCSDTPMASITAEPANLPSTTDRPITGRSDSLNSNSSGLARRPRIRSRTRTLPESSGWSDTTGALQNQVEDPDMGESAPYESQVAEGQLVAESTQSVRPPRPPRSPRRSMSRPTRRPPSNRSISLGPNRCPSPRPTTTLTTRRTWRPTRNSSGPRTPTAWAISSPPVSCLGWCAAQPIRWRSSLGICADGPSMSSCARPRTSHADNPP